MTRPLLLSLCGALVLALFYAAVVAFARWAARDAFRRAVGWRG